MTETGYMDIEGKRLKVTASSSRELRQAVLSINNLDKSPEGIVEHFEMYKHFEVEIV